MTHVWWAPRTLQMEKQGYIDGNYQDLHRREKERERETEEKKILNHHASGQSGLGVNPIQIVCGSHFRRQFRNLQGDE